MRFSRSIRIFRFSAALEKLSVVFVPVHSVIFIASQKSRRNTMEFDLKKDLNTKLLTEEDTDSGSPSSPVAKERKCCAKLNNKTVLFIVCCLFACFASAEMAGAFVSVKQVAGMFMILYRSCASF